MWGLCCFCYQSYYPSLEQIEIYNEFTKLTFSDLDQTLHVLLDRVETLERSLSTGLQAPQFGTRIANNFVPGNNFMPNHPPPMPQQHLFFSSNPHIDTVGKVSILHQIEISKGTSFSNFFSSGYEMHYQQQQQRNTAGPPPGTAATIANYPVVTNTAFDIEEHIYKSKMWLKQRNQSMMTKF